jgi:hypothetical protein
MESEHDNLREALVFATTDGQIERALTMAAGMNLFWKLHSHFGEAKATSPPCSSWRPRTAAAPGRRMGAGRRVLVDG